MELVGGHPYLVTEAFEQVVQQQCTVQALLQIAHTESGIYGNHLRQLLVELEKNPKLLNAMKKVITTTEPVRLDTTLKFQLQRMGLLHLQNNKVTISRELYRQYFCDCLGIT
jgi:RNA binding exosome subunit